MNTLNKDRVNILSDLWLCSASVKFSSCEGTRMQKLSSATAVLLFFPSLKQIHFVGQ